MFNLQIWIRNYLGIGGVSTEVIRLQAQINNLRTKLDLLNKVLGRMLGKIDPIYAVPELDPQRRAESDRIGAEILARLQAEADVARKYNYKDD